MGKIPFDNAHCNGWAIYDDEYIVGENARNIHVAECEIRFDENGNKHDFLNSARETVCKRHLVDGKRQYTISSTDDSEIRSNLTKLENQGNKVCGVCVSHFHVDKD